MATHYDKHGPRARDLGRVLPYDRHREKGRSAPEHPFGPNFSLQARTPDMETKPGNHTNPVFCYKCTQKENKMREVRRHYSNFEDKPFGVVRDRSALVLKTTNTAFDIVSNSDVTTPSSWIHILLSRETRYQWAHLWMFASRLTFLYFRKSSTRL